MKLKIIIKKKRKTNPKISVVLICLQQGHLDIYFYHSTLDLFSFFLISVTVNLKKESLLLPPKKFGKVEGGRRGGGGWGEVNRRLVMGTPFQGKLFTPLRKLFFNKWQKKNQRKKLSFFFFMCEWQKEFFLFYYYFFI